MNNLRLAESKKPWLLITEPTLSKKYFSPNKKRIFILGSVIGLIFGATLCYLKETQSKIVYEPKFLKKIFNKSNLINLQDYDETKWTKLLVIYFQ